MLRIFFALLALVPAAASAPDQPPSPTGAHICDDYPLSAAAVHAEGVTIMKFIVGADGKVHDPQVDKSSGNADLDTAAARCVQHWLYNPATRDGTAAAAPWQAAVQWKIPDYAAILLAARCSRDLKLDPAMFHGGSGHTQLTFRVTPDHVVKDTAVKQGSGNAEVDEAGVNCSNGTPYDPGPIDLPPEGLAGHIEINWLDQIERDQPMREPFPTGLVQPDPIKVSDCATRAHGHGAKPTALEYVIGDGGTVRGVRVTASSGVPALDTAAALCVGDWFYFPAMWQGPHAVYATTEIVWKDQ